LRVGRFKNEPTHPLFDILRRIGAEGVAQERLDHRHFAGAGAFCRELSVIMVVADAPCPVPGQRELDDFRT
jgi:hypothetical protein